MDNVKTGALIKQLRRDKGMTQKDLAGQLHITDRAVSKWERGISAPDISLLEPLSEILGVSVVELIRGELAESAAPEAESAARETLDYSRSELRRRTRTLRLRHLLIALGAVLLAALVCFAALSYSGRLYIIDDVDSPDGTANVTVYSKGFSGWGHGFSTRDAVSLVLRDSSSRGRITYGDCRYAGLWWAPDGSKYVLALEGWDGEGNTSLMLNWWDDNSESYLDFYLSSAAYSCGLPGSGDDYWLFHDNVEFRFVQWAGDSENMLISYTLEAPDGTARSGYFWYNCMTKEADGLLELGRE